MSTRRLRHGAQLALTSPSTAWMLTRMLAWKQTLAVLKRVVPFRTLVRVAQPRRVAAAEDAEERARIEYIVARLGGDDDCVERSLVAYRFLARAGSTPKLFLGFDHGTPRRGHAWVEVDDGPIVESRAALQPFVPVAEFPRSA